MSRSLRRLAAALAVAGLLLAPSVAPASTSSQSGRGLMQLEPGNSPPVFDALFIRPLGFAGLAISAGFWVPAQAITMMVRPSEWRTPIEYMLRRPYEFVFVDPLGSH